MQHTEFNFEDMSRNASKYLDEVKQKAMRIVQDAQKQAQAVLAQAAQQGRQAAEEAATKAALADVQERWQTLAPALQQAIDSAEQLKAAWIKQWESNVIHLVIAIAQQVIRGELTRQPEISQQWIREALELAAGSTTITLLLNPDDYAAIADQRDSLQRQFSQLADAKFVADAAISPGGCRVVTDYGYIDQQVESQLARIEQELTT